MNKVKFSGWKYGERCLSSQGNRTIIMQMPFEIQLDLAAVVESPRTYYTEPTEHEGGWTMFFQVFVIWQSKNVLLLAAPDLQTIRRLCLHVPRKSMKEAEGGWLKYTHINSTRYMDREWAKEQGVHNVSFSKFKVILTLNSLLQTTFFGLKTLMKRLMNIMLPENKLFFHKNFLQQNQTSDKPIILSRNCNPICGKTKTHRERPLMTSDFRVQGKIRRTW